MNNKDWETIEIENQPRLKSIGLNLILTCNIYIISLAWFPDSVCLEVRIVDRIVNFRLALVNALVFCRLTFPLPRFPEETFS